MTVRASDGTAVDHIGHVLADDKDVLEVLDHDPRVVLRLRSADVVGRVVCRLPASTDDTGSESVLSWVLTRLDVPSPRGGAPDC